MAIHDKAWKRKQDYQKALHKQQVAHDVLDRDVFDNLHEYSKNKVFNSSPLNSARGILDGMNCPRADSIADQRKIIDMEDEIKDYGMHEST